MSIIFIDARVSGYKGDPVRLVGACNPESGRLKVTLIKPYLEKDKSADKDSDVVIVTDSPSHFPIWHQHFDEKRDLSDVIQVYQEKKRGGLISWSQNLIIYVPDNVLQVRKLDAGGQSWEFDGEMMNNGHMALLLCAWASARVSLNHTITEQVSPDYDNIQLDDDPALPYSIW